MKVWTPLRGAFPRGVMLLAVDMALGVAHRFAIR